MTNTAAYPIRLLNVDYVPHATHDVEAHSADCQDARRKLQFPRQYIDAGLTRGATKLDVWENYNGDYINVGQPWAIRFYACTGLNGPGEGAVDYDGSQVS